LQFFPEKLPALSELQRVLVLGGALILTVWSSISPLSAAIAEVTGRYIGPASASALSPLAFRDAKIIKALLIEAGLPNIAIEELGVERRIGPADEAILKRLPVPRRFTRCEVG